MLVSRNRKNPVSSMSPRRALSVQSKLLVAFVLLTVAAIGVASWVGYLTARQSLTGSVQKHLVTLQRSKAATVRNMLTATRNEVLAISDSEGIVRTAVVMRAAYRALAGATVTPEMTDAVRRFHLEEYSPAVAKRLSVAPVAGWSLPTSTEEWYLHYHYLVRAPRPYGPSRVLESSTDTSTYGTALKEVQQKLGPSLERFGFHNVILVDPETLEVFYSYEASTIVGTNFATGPYATSNVAALARDLSLSKATDDYRVADFDQYQPKLGAPMAFIGSPVFDGPRVVAVMLLRFPIEPIADALSGGRQWEAEGLGKTGEAYLLGPDMTMRTDSRFLIEDPTAFFAALRRSTLTTRTADTIERLNTTILTMPVKHAAARAALRGESGLMEVDDGYRGVPVLMAYGPVDLDSLRWGVIARVDKTEAMAPLAEYTRRVLVTGVGLTVVACLLALVMATSLTRPIAALVKAARRVSQGTLDVQVDVAPDDEYRELGEAFNEMVRSLRSSREDLDRQVQENERLLQSLCRPRPPRRSAGARPRRRSPSPTSPSPRSTWSASMASRSSWAKTARWGSSAISSVRWTRPPSSTEWRRCGPSVRRTSPPPACPWSDRITPRAWWSSPARPFASSAGSTPSARRTSRRKSASTPARSSAA